MIVLLDLNYTLVANSSVLSRTTLAYRQANESYRSWLLDLIVAWKPEQIVLLTVRNVRDKDWTLANIKQRCGWEPDWALFNDLGDVSPPAWKEHALQTHIFPRFGSDGSRYLAVESNIETHKMFEKYGIKGLKVFPSTERTNVKPNNGSKQPNLF